MRREVAHVEGALAATGVPFILLKGAAYLLAGLKAARGRMFSDIDILVPRRALPDVEAALMLSGWASANITPYDQRYYRRWMHELPPLKHISRRTLLDVHHAILPTTARLKPDSAKLLAASLPVAGKPRPARSCATRHGPAQRHASVLQRGRRQQPARPGRPGQPGARFRAGERTSGRGSRCARPSSI